MENYNYNNLMEIVGDNVAVSDDEGNQQQLKIDSVSTSSMHGEDWEAFSVLFRGDESFHIPQGTYQFDHPAFGQVSLFVSPKSEIEYETVINRRRHPEKASA